MYVSVVCFWTRYVVFMNDEKIMKIVKALLLSEQYRFWEKTE